MLRWTTRSAPIRRRWNGPRGAAVDNQGALLVADDVGNIIWCVTSVP